MKYLIVKNKDFLCTPCPNVSDIDEGNEIAGILWNVLKKHKNGIGLAANQVGIQKRVAVVKIKDREPLVLINPKIIQLDDPIVFPYDGCLSFPGVEITTQRHIWVTVETDNIGTVMFGPSGTEEITWKDPKLWESIAVQHEIDHLDGKTMFDRQIKKAVPIIKTKKYGRNEKVTITDGTISMNLKYKKAQHFLNSGWTINV